MFWFFGVWHKMCLHWFVLLLWTLKQCGWLTVQFLTYHGDNVTLPEPSLFSPPSNQAFESTLKSWEDKRKIDTYHAARPRLNSQQSMEYLTEEECAQVQQLGTVADSLINKYETRCCSTGLCPDTTRFNMLYFLYYQLLTQDVNDVYLWKKVFWYALNVFDTVPTATTIINPNTTTETTSTFTNITSSTTTAIATTTFTKTTAIITLPTTV